MRKPRPLFVFALLSAIGLFALSRTSTGEEVIRRTIDRTLPRGIRNNNPGNIERTGTRWRGMSANQSGDDRFIVFDSPEWGIRAMTRVIKNYMQRGLYSVRQIINTWAPPSENDTGAYVNAVADRLGVNPDDALNEGYLPDLIDAIIRHENGMQPYASDVIARGIDLERIG